MSNVARTTESVEQSDAPCGFSPLQYLSQKRTPRVGEYEKIRGEMSERNDMLSLLNIIENC